MEKGSDYRIMVRSCSGFVRVSFYRKWFKTKSIAASAKNDDIRAAFIPQRNPSITPAEQAVELYALFFSAKSYFFDTKRNEN